MNPSTVLLLLATSTFAQVSAGVVKPPTNNASLNHLPPADAAWLPVPYEMIFNSTQRKGSEIFRGSNYLCQTSNASPLVADLVPCVAWLDRQPDWKACRQNNPWGSKCTQMVSYRGAALGVCGPWREAVNCRFAGAMHAWLVGKCRNWKTNKSGGWLRYDNGLITNMYHT